MANSIRSDARASLTASRGGVRRALDIGAAIVVCRASVSRNGTGFRPSRAAVSRQGHNVRRCGITRSGDHGIDRGVSREGDHIRLPCLGSDLGNHIGLHNVRCARIKRRMPIGAGIDRGRAAAPAANQRKGHRKYCYCKFSRHSLISWVVLV